MKVKICGLRTRADVRVAAEAGATYVGFVFFPKSPRNITLGDAAWIAPALTGDVLGVGLTVDASDEDLAAILEAIPLNMIQLHGHESPDRVREVRERFELPVMKAVGVATHEDLEALDAYSEVSDMVLVDARPDPNADRPGGNGQAFDWSLIQQRKWTVPWLLAGGLNPENVGEAIRFTGATQVDVSSGVESRAGYKDHDLIRSFVKQANAAS